MRGKRPLSWLALSMAVEALVTGLLRDRCYWYVNIHPFCIQLGATHPSRYVNLQNLGALRLSGLRNWDLGHKIFHLIPDVFFILTSMQWLDSGCESSDCQEL